MNRLDHKLPVVIDKVTIKGNERTKNSFIESELKTILAQDLPLPHLEHELNHALSRLKGSGLFSSVNVKIDMKHFDEVKNQFHSDIQLDVKEKGIPFLKLETYVKSRSTAAVSNEVGAEVIGALRNPFGYGDIHKLSYSTNSTGGFKEYLVSSHFPHFYSSYSSTSKDLSPPSVDKTDISMIAAASTTTPHKKLTFAEQLKLIDGYNNSNSTSTTTTVKDTIEHTNSYYSKNLGITLKAAEEDNSYFLKYKQKIHSLVVDITPGISFVNIQHPPSAPSHCHSSANSTRSYQIPHASNQHRYQLEISARDEIPTDSGSSSVYVSPPTAATSSTTSGTAQVAGGIGGRGSLNIRKYPNASVLSQIFPSTKLSLKHTYTLTDTRDSTTVPTNGAYVQTHTELATPIGTAQFIKSELLTQYHRSFGPALFNQQAAVSVSGSLGIILPLKSIQHKITQASSQWMANNDVLHNESTTPRTLLYRKSNELKNDRVGFVHLSDRYFLGGPLSLRGFQLYGVGHQQHGDGRIGNGSSINNVSMANDDSSASNSNNTDTGTGASLGGVTKCTLLTAVSAPLPLEQLARVGARAFAFINIGGIGSTALYDYKPSSSSHSTYASTSTSASATNTSSLTAAAAVESTSTNNASSTFSSSSLFGAMRVSVGGGVAVPLGSAARLELTYAIPLVKSSSDVVKPFQIGVGVTIN